MGSEFPAPPEPRQIWIIRYCSKGATIGLDREDGAGDVRIMSAEVRRRHHLPFTGRALGFKPKELAARQEVLYENYTQHILIEANTMVDMMNPRRH